MIPHPEARKREVAIMRATTSAYTGPTHIDDEVVRVAVPPTERDVRHVAETCPALRPSGSRARGRDGRAVHEEASPRGREREAGRPQAQRDAKALVRSMVDRSPRPPG